MYSSHLTLQYVDFFFFFFNMLTFDNDVGAENFYIKQILYFKGIIYHFSLSSIHSGKSFLKYNLNPNFR